MTQGDQSPAVDVVIPVRNGARFVKPCLDSVLAQTLPPNRAIVVDDGSTDDTPRVLAGYSAQWPKLDFIRSEPHGVSHARNLALQASLAPFVAFLDIDDVWKPQKLQKQMKLFAASGPDVGFVHCGCYYIDELGKSTDEPGLSPHKRGDIFLDLLTGYAFAGSASGVVARRDLVMAVGGFDERLFHGEDTDLWLKLAKSSHVDFVPDALTGIRIHTGSSQRKYARHKAESFLFERLRVLDKWVDHVPDRDRFLDHCRAAAVRVGIKNVIRLGPRFGLHRRLQTSEIALARMLFPDRPSYLRSLVKEVGDIAQRKLANVAKEQAAAR